jgi:hypothetical protein
VKINLEEKGTGMSIELNWFKTGSSGLFCEHDNESSGSIKWRESLNQLSDY